MKAYLVTVALILAAGPAVAHAFLKSASPAVGAAVSVAPRQVEIGFTEGVEPAFSTIAVTDAKGARVDQGPAHRTGDAAHLAVALGQLSAGRYTVVWHALSTDTHKTQGSYGFTVAP